MPLLLHPESERFATKFAFVGLLIGMCSLVMVHIPGVRVFIITVLALKRFLPISVCCNVFR